MKSTETKKKKGFAVVQFRGGPVKVTPLPENPKERKVKGFVHEEFMKGWRGKDGGVIVYRFAAKSEKHMLPIVITYSLSKTKK